ncbi:sulfotransferase [Paraglaciecola agarilytica]|nr:sulfotransferase [Paraglaciecola agarilytica]
MERLRKAVKRIKDISSLYCLRLLGKAANKHFSSSPILLLSYPRSGSSWAGKILATSSQLAYVREPVTQPYLKRYSGERPVFMLNDSHADAAVYTRLANQTFSGVPSLHKGVVDNKRDFLPYSKTKPKKLLIKEVNPGAARFYCTHYDLSLLLLLRHPAAVALSFYEMGWLNKHGKLLKEDTQLDEWGRFGKLYGMFMADAVEVANRYQQSKIIRYEQLVNAPEQEFSDIFKHCNVEAPDYFDSVIAKYCHAKNDISSGYQTQRDSKLTSEKWKNKLNAEQLASLRKGFLESKLEFYQDPSDWMV